MNEIKNLINQKFGRWTVIGSYITFKNSKNKTERKWLCRCDCGTEKYVLERNLLFGGSKSCGCAKRENSLKAIAYDLHGKIFGDLEVLAVAADHPRDTRGGVWWRCHCSCGKDVDVLASLLVTGRKTHCGCKTEPKAYYSVDIREQRFGRLTAKYPLPQRDHKGGVIWHCVCDCGSTIDIPYNWLVYNNMRSCGCQKKEHDRMMPSFITRVDGTSLDMIKSKKLPADNTSGIKGVYYQKGKWMAKIVFQKKQYHLGWYDNIEDAAKARKDAEELLFDGVSNYYDRWKLRADTDPEWAAENPIRINVEKVNNELRVVILPLLISSERTDVE